MTQLDLFPIGNCALASLIDSRSRHVWFCFPSLDGDPVYNALVNGKDPENGFMDNRAYPRQPERDPQERERMGWASRKSASDEYHRAQC